MGTFTVTFRMSIDIKAKSFEEAQEKFDNLSAKKMREAEFVEVVSLEDENGREYND